MTDRPILFSAIMVLALLAGTKTQTRRLATSPLRHVEVGDRLWVREDWSTPTAYDDLKPSEMGGEEALLYRADRATALQYSGETAAPFGRRRAGMHMPRWASRLTLVVEEKRFEPLRTIAGNDPRFEGVERVGQDWRDYSGRFPVMLSARESYQTLWDCLHTEPGERWEDNPEIVALTFAVEQRNIDR